MAKGRRIPPLVLLDPPPPPTQGYQRAQDADCAYFTTHHHDRVHARLHPR